MPKSIVCDTSVWLYLGRINQIELLVQIYDQVHTTEDVCQELDIGRLSRPTTIDPRKLSWVQIASPSSAEFANLPTNRLGRGEQSVIAYAQAKNLHIVGLDDRQARGLATQIGLHVIGTVGLMLKAKQNGLIHEIRPFLSQLQQEGFYFSEQLLTGILQQAGELAD